MKRFFNKVDVKSKEECWNWLASSRGKGYGAFKLNGKVVDAHRVSWILHNGEIPENIFICHKCDNPSCVNPDHLFLGTHSDNMNDAYNKKRLKIPDNSKNIFQLGHVPINRSISKEESIKIKNEIENRGKKSLKELARELDIKYQLIRDISCGRIYKS